MLGLSKYIQVVGYAFLYDEGLNSSYVKPSTEMGVA
jgi:hypothetical protein